MYLFVSFPVTSQPGICVASTMLPVVLKVKEPNIERLHIALELEEFYLPFEFLETSKRGFNFAPREGTWIEVLRGEYFANYRLYCNASC